MRLPLGCETVVRIAILLVLSTSASSADVWRISSKSGHVYIGGTFHLLAPADYPLPAEYDAAYSASQIVVLEADLDRIRAPEFQPGMIKAVSFEPGKSISDVLKPATLRQLDTYLAGRGIALKDLAAFKPGMLSIMLSIVEMQRLGLTGIGADEHFQQKARQDGKPLQWFETAEQQLALIATMGEGYEDDLIVSTLRDIENLQPLMKDMKKAWREGDTRQLEAIALTPSQQQFPGLMDSLLFQRNDNWIPAIEKMVASDDTEFILVGALHLVGNRGLLSQLQQRGYCVEKGVSNTTCNEGRLKKQDIGAVN